MGWNWDTGCERSEFWDNQDHCQDTCDCDDCTGAREAEAETTKEPE